MRTLPLPLRKRLLQRRPRVGRRGGVELHVFDVAQEFVALGVVDAGAGRELVAALVHQLAERLGVQVASAPRR